MKKLTNPQKLLIQMLSMLISEREDFTVCFRKRTTGDLRVMRCRARAFRYDKRGLVHVVDLEAAEKGKRPHRTFGIEAVAWVKAFGCTLEMEKS